MKDKICPLCDKLIDPFDPQTNYGKDDEKGKFYDPVHSACLDFNIKRINAIAYFCEMKIYPASSTTYIQDSPLKIIDGESIYYSDIFLVERYHLIILLECFSLTL